MATVSAPPRRTPGAGFACAALDAVPIAAAAALPAADDAAGACNPVLLSPAFLFPPPQATSARARRAPPPVKSHRVLSISCSSARLRPSVECRRAPRSTSGIAGSLQLMHLHYLCLFCP